VQFVEDIFPFSTQNTTSNSHPITTSTTSLQPLTNLQLFKSPPIANMPHINFSSSSPNPGSPQTSQSPLPSLVTTTPNTTLPSSSSHPIVEPTLSTSPQDDLHSPQAAPALANPLPNNSIITRS
jgi:hypothetical protein